MNLPILEIIILLFILFPFIKQLIDNLKGEQKKPERPARTSQKPDPWDKPEEYDWSGGQESEKQPSWEEAFKDLEEIFTGQTSGQTDQPREPEPEPVHRGTRSTTSEPSQAPGQTTTASTTSHSTDQYRGRVARFEHQEHMDHMEHGDLSIGSSNPIYNERLGSRRGEGGNTRAASKIRKTFKDADAVRAAFIFKEVLDRPLPGRRTRNRSRI